MGNRRMETNYRNVLKVILLFATCISLPVIAWAQAQWTTSSNDIYNSNSGNVGIGTTTQNTRLHVKSADSNSYGQVEIESTGNDARISFYNSDGAASTGRADILMSRSSGYEGLRFMINNSDKMIVDESGNVGIGTTSPSSRLDVVGDITVSGNISAKYQDLAEWVSTSRVLPAGTVVALDTEFDNEVVPSSLPYDTHVAGVVSDSPGIILGVAGPGKLKIATTGRVKVRVDATNAPIRRGDLLVTGPKEGTAMRSETVNVAGIEMHRPGSLIGKALEPLDEGEGEILVLLSLQ